MCLRVLDNHVFTFFQDSGCPEGQRPSGSDQTSGFNVNDLRWLAAGLVERHQHTASQQSQVTTVNAELKYLEGNLADEMPDQKDLRSNEYQSPTSQGVFSRRNDWIIARQGESTERAAEDREDVRV